MSKVCNKKIWLSCQINITWFNNIMSQLVIIINVYRPAIMHLISFIHLSWFRLMNIDWFFLSIIKYVSYEHNTIFLMKLNLNKYSTKEIAVR